MQIAAKSRKPVQEQVEEKPAPLPTDFVEHQVFTRLGKPSDLHTIRIFRYTPTHCRVNIYRKMDKDATATHFERAAAIEKYYLDNEMRIGTEKICRSMEGTITGTIVLITDSFYIRTDANGMITGGEEITRRYE